MAEGVTDLYQIDKRRLRHKLRKVYCSKDEMWPEIKEVIENIYEKDNSEATLRLTGEAVRSEKGKNRINLTKLLYYMMQKSEPKNFPSDLPATSEYGRLGAVLHGLVSVPMV